VRDKKGMMGRWIPDQVGDDRWRVGRRGERRNKIKRAERRKYKYAFWVNM